MTLASILRRAGPAGAILVSLGVAWVSAGSQPLTDAVTGALVPIDFARDYTSAHAHIHRTAGTGAGNEASNDYARSIGVPPITLLDAPYYVHPPTALLFVLPLVPLGFGGAALAWLTLSLIALAMLAPTLVRIATRTERPPTLRVVLAFLLLVLWPPVLHNLAKGQWSIFLATLIGAGWRALDRGHPRTAGVWLGLAASLKATPVLLLGYLLLRHRRAAQAMASTMVFLGVASLALFGLPPWRTWIANAHPNALAWQTWIANTASLNGAIARLFAGGPFAQPLIQAPTFAQALSLGVTLLLIALAVFCARRAAPTALEDRRLFAAWTVLVVVANPIAWTHTTVIALVPIALLVDVAPPAILATALTLLTVPHEALATLAGPVPVTPGRGLALSAHAAALLLLFGIGVWSFKAEVPRA